MTTLVENRPSTFLGRDPNRPGDSPTAYQIPPIYLSPRKRPATRLDLIEDLIAWSTDPEGMDREAIDSVDRNGWGIQG